jgi:hypothetical protein
MNAFEELVRYWEEKDQRSKGAWKSHIAQAEDYLTTFTTGSFEERLRLLVLCGSEQEYCGTHCSSEQYDKLWDKAVEDLIADFIKESANA